MIINNENKFVFIHIPKTAGTSLAKSIGQSLEKCEFGGMGKKLDTHATIRQVRRHLGQKYDSYYSFAFVRNPWDRMLSWYAFLCHGETVRRPLQAKVKAMGFKRWLMQDEHILKNSFDSNEKKVAGQRRSQLDWIGENDAILVDFVGRFENLEHDYEVIRGVIGSGPLLREHKKKSNHAHYREVYDDEMRQFVEEYFSRDIEAFGYEF
jgi:chondroitin 4-sulfotransferase 11